MISWRMALLFVIFLISRIWVLQHPPANYSDVTHDYERYANQWRYGLTPYRQIMFEYPPAVIPLIALPLELDQRGIGKYYLNYRIQMFTFEIILFTAMVFCVLRVRKETESKHLGLQDWRSWIPLIFYIGAGILAKDYWYEGIDLIFFGSFTLGLMFVLAKHQTFLKRVFLWTLFWLSVAIKIMTLPLAFPIYLTKTLPWKKELLACVLGGVLVWGVPIVLYRSSLSVFITFHANRPMKYGAFGSYIVEAINDYTRSEYRLMEAPDFPMIGPVAKNVTAVSKTALPLAVILILGYAWSSAQSLKKAKNPRLARFEYLTRISLLYIFTLFLVGKTFSSPFHIWYLPLMVVYPFSSFSQQLLSYSAVLLMLGLDTTPFIQVPKDIIAFANIPWTRVRDGLRFIPMFFVLWLLTWKNKKEVLHG